MCDVRKGTSTRYFITNECQFDHYVYVITGLNINTCLLVHVQMILRSDTSIYLTSCQIWEVNCQSPPSPHNKYDMIKNLTKYLKNQTVFVTVIEHNICIKNKLQVLKTREMNWNTFFNKFSNLSQRFLMRSRLKNDQMINPYSFTLALFPCRKISERIWWGFSDSVVFKSVSYIMHKQYAS